MHRKSLLAISAVLLTCAVALLSPAALYAGVEYTYAGNPLGPDPPYTFNPPYTASDSVKGYFTVGASLGDNLAFTNITGLVTSFWFTDGVQTLTQNTPGVSDTIEVATDGSGEVDAWEVEVGDCVNCIILSCNGDLTGTDACSPGNGWGVGGAADETFYPGSVGLIEGYPGKWSVPEPSSVVLLGSGVLGLVGAVRRKLRR